MVNSLFVAEIIPSVTVPPSVPRGLPITTAVSPTANLSLSPIVAGVNPSASTLSTAISLLASVPTRVAS